MRRIRQRTIYVHNDLASAAFHFKQIVEERSAAGAKEGIAFDRMACMISLAFTFEAYLNFLGYKLIQGWEERDAFHKKLKRVLKHLSLSPDQNVRPYKSIETLKQFRDSLAHGKPKELSDTDVLEKHPGPIGNPDLDADWVAYCEHDAVLQTYDDVEAVWQEMLMASRLNVTDTLTHGEWTIEVVKPLVSPSKVPKGGSQ